MDLAFLTRYYNRSKQTLLSHSYCHSPLLARDQGWLCIILAWGTRLWLSPLTMEPDCVSATVLFFFLTPKSLHASPAPCAATASKGPNDDKRCLGLHTFLFIISLLIIVTLSTCYTTHPSPYMSHLCPVPPPWSKAWTMTSVVWAYIHFFFFFSYI
jgi:hypothetical protein